MATLHQQRQAIAAGMSASRAATGQAARQAGGQAMIAQRTGTAVAADINVLTNPQKARKTLTPVRPVGALPASQGRGVYKPPAATGTSGIASPLTEKTSTADDGTVASLREYWPEGRKSSDGLFVLPALKTLVLDDADGREVIVNLAQPI